jgi:AcrR family transcriptional regulator
MNRPTASTRPPRKTSAASTRLARPPADRRGAILQSAQRLFAERGFHGVSIRDIAHAAGVPLALVGYYFGPKLELYHTIFREHAAYLQTRLHGLAQAQAHAAPDELLTEIVKAFVLPVLELDRTADGHTFLRLLARGMSEQLEEDRPIIEELFDPLATAFIDALTTAQPGVPRTTVAWCYQFALGALIHHVTDDRIRRLSPGGAAEQRRHAADLLVRFIAQGITGASAASVDARSP